MKSKRRTERSIDTSIDDPGWLWPAISSNSPRFRGFCRFGSQQRQKRMKIHVSHC